MLCYLSLHVSCKRISIFVLFSNLIFLKWTRPPNGSTRRPKGLPGSMFNRCLTIVELFLRKSTEHLLRKDQYLSEVRNKNKLKKQRERSPCGDAFFWKLCLGKMEHGRSECDDWYLTLRFVHPKWNTMAIEMHARLPECLLSIQLRSDSRLTRRLLMIL